jgi:hypothetical protein
MHLDVEHYLGVYRIRKRMQDEGITNPPEEIKEFTRKFVEKLEGLPLKEKIILRDYSFYDSNGNLIVTIPVE